MTTTLTVKDLLVCLLGVVDKAGRIAKICRKDEHLLSLLVQEKKETDKNPRFSRDFKTLADVLVQEVIKCEVCSQFSEFEGHIHGEEVNEFSNDEATITVEVRPNEKETSDLLERVLNDTLAAASLARVIHSECAHNFELDFDEPENFRLPEKLALWIDPIDSTAEYIQGRTEEDEPMIKVGLPCVTMLVGVFDRSTGSPIIGVVYQPFSKWINDEWTHEYFYGISLPGFTITHPYTPVAVRGKLVAVSMSEENEVREKIVSNGYATIELAGAGYKLLKIITGEVDAYVLTKPTTFWWDTCACQAILKSLGGDIISLATLRPIEYREGKGVKECCNDGGIIAYRSEEVKNDLIRILDLTE